MASAARELETTLQILRYKVRNTGIDAKRFSRATQARKKSYEKRLLKLDLASGRYL